MKKVCIVLLALCVSAAVFAKDLAVDQVASVFTTPDMITIQPQGDFETFKLVVNGPNGAVISQEYSGMHIASVEAVDMDGNVLPDGKYTFELIATPILSDNVKQAMRDARQSGDFSEVEALRADGLIPSRDDMIKTGTFTIHNGFIIVGDEEPKLTSSLQALDGRDGSVTPGNPTGGGSSSTPQTGRFDDPDRAQVFATDLIVEGSSCIGVDCSTTESFGFDTIKLKENNLRIKFEDTSASANFPGVDWQLLANESSNGGLNKFSIEDVTNSKTSFTIEANAPNNMLYISDDGRIGIKTNTPAVGIHYKHGDSPTLRLEQDGSSGFQSQVWDLAGNETNFFIRDVTNGSLLPFRIKPNTPKNRLYMDATGIGFGTESPNAKAHYILGEDNGSLDGAVLIERTDSNDPADSNAFLHVRGDSAKVTIEDTTGNGDDIPLTLKSAGTVNYQMIDTANGNNWSTGVNATVYFMSKSGTGVKEFTIDASGNVVAQGTVTANGVVLTSDRNAKKNFQEVDTVDVLNKVLEMPVTTWNFKDHNNGLHMGPMAQDFHAAFGLGTTDTKINMTDSVGVAFGAIQGMAKVIEEKDQKIADLEARLKAIEEALLNQ